MRLDGEPPRRELLQQLMLRVHRQLLAGRLDVETEDLQLAAAGGLWGGLAQGPPRRPPPIFCFHVAAPRGAAGVCGRGGPRPPPPPVPPPRSRPRGRSLA